MISLWPSHATSRIIRHRVRSTTRRYCVLRSHMCMKNSFCDFGMASSVQSCVCLRALEFYAGVGGFHYGLLKSGVNADVVGSFDLNPTANEIYRHNFPNTAHLNRNICGLTASELDKLEPDIMHMSPPRQPFTRQGLRRDKEDGRTDSFFHLMLTISEIRTPQITS